ncbi:hypothetical protein N0V84_006343 [Fusarium piperis]|uniref:Uncharacterized protein n=1 Tax=Fusarium piperis TaxID=1435070 RepID=A0A9W8WC07_9HYPO|nr:hypothetical protein N0V84_006343 [Fusarium piperis]
MDLSESVPPKCRIAMISGHIDISPSEFATNYNDPINEAVARGDRFILGDAKGADELALDYILRLDPTARITVYASRAERCKALKDRNIDAILVKPMQKRARGRQHHLERDAEMTNSSDYDILWVRDEEACRKLYGEKYRPRISATELNRRRRIEAMQKVNVNLTA